MSTITTKLSPVISRLNHRGEVISSPDGDKYACVDEAYINNLTTLQWNRNNGTIDLIPIAVVVRDTY